MPELHTGEWFLLLMTTAAGCGAGVHRQSPRLGLGFWALSRVEPSWVPLQFRSPWQWGMSWVGCFHKHIPSP